MVIKGDGNLLTIAWRGIYAQGRVGQYHADWSYAFSVILENVEFAFAVVETLYLRTSVGAEVHKDSNGELISSIVLSRSARTIIAGAILIIL